MTGAPPPVLVLGWGNASRGDDALGPLFISALQLQLPESIRDRVEFLEDYQLQIKHALDLVGREHILFVDASLDCVQPFLVQSAVACRDHSITSHALTPQGLLQVYCDLYDTQPAPATLLAIRGESFALGDPLGSLAQEHLTAALAWGLQWVGARASATTHANVPPH